MLGAVVRLREAAGTGLGPAPARGAAPRTAPAGGLTRTSTNAGAEGGELACAQEECDRNLPRPLGGALRRRVYLRGNKRRQEAELRQCPSHTRCLLPETSHRVIHCDTCLSQSPTLQSHITESDTRVLYHRALQLHRGRPLYAPQAGVKWCRKPQRRAVPPCLLPPGTQTFPLRLFAVLNPHLHLTGFDQGYSCQDYLQSHTKLTQGPMHPE